MKDCKRNVELFDIFTLSFLTIEVYLNLLELLRIPREIIKYRISAGTLFLLDVNSSNKREKSRSFQ